MRLDITADNIVKQYKAQKLRAVDEVSFDVPKGQLFGLIGPDGAGKTSIFRILATLILPDSGHASVCGFDVVNSYTDIRRITGYMPGKFSLYRDLSVEENLQFFATVFGTTIKENYELIRDIYIQLEPFKNRRAEDLSGGMKQKLALCCALIHKPRILLLDEPTTGVDAVSRVEFWEILKKLRQEGITIMVATPYMDEATLCERIGLIQNGKLLSVDTPEGMISRFPVPLFSAKCEDIGGLLGDLRDIPSVESCNSFGGSVHITLRSGIIAEEIIRLKSELHSRGRASVEIAEIRPTVEDCFIRLMN